MRTYLTVFKFRKCKLDALQIYKDLFRRLKYDYSNSLFISLPPGVKLLPNVQSKVKQPRFPWCESSCRNSSFSVWGLNFFLCGCMWRMYASQSIIASSIQYFQEGSWVFYWIFANGEQFSFTFHFWFQHPCFWVDII